MKLVPSYQLQVLQEEAFSEQMPIISHKLLQCREEGFFSGTDGKTLYYECYQVEESRGAVVIVHGLSEFTAKYHEFAWYLLNQGYDVFLYDQRCHGRSCRLTEDEDTIHVEEFEDYRKDLELFIQGIVRKRTDKKLYLYGHSMGGAVVLQYLAEHPQVVEKAILSAPMIEPLTGKTPVVVARVGLSLKALLGEGKEKFMRTAAFDPDYPFERSQDKSRARFGRNMDLRRENPCYRTTPLSVRWVQQSLLLRAKLTKKRFLEKLTTPIMMLCAEKEAVVSTKAQKEFAEKYQNCQRIVLPNATHSLLWGTQPCLEELVQRVLDYFR